MDRRSAPDKGYAWIVLIASFFANVIMMGVIISSGLFLVEWYATYNFSKVVISWIQGVTTLSRAPTGFLAGGFVNRYGCRKVHFIGSFITAVGCLIMAVSPRIEVIFAGAMVQGLGTGLLYTAPVTIIFDYFERHKALASGLSLCGHSLSALFIVAILRLSVDHYGWRGGMLILAGICLNGCALSMFFVPNCRGKSKDEITDKTQTTKNNVTTQMEQKTNMQLVQTNASIESEQTMAVSSESKTKTDHFNFSLFKNPQYMLFLSAFVCLTVDMELLYQLTPTRAVSKGHSVTQGSYLVTIIGLGSTGSRVVASFLSNMSWSPRHVTLYVVCLAALAVFLLTSCFVSAWIAGLSVCAAGFGICIGCCFTVTPALLRDMLGGERLATSWSFVNSVSGLVRSLALPIGGFMYDMTGDFNTSFYFASAIGAMSTLCGVGVVVMDGRKSRVRDADMAA